MQYSKNFYQIKSNDEIFEEIKKEQESIGYYSLPTKDISDIKQYAKTITKKHIAVIGVGGSSLGALAIYEFLKKSHTYSKQLHFFDTTDPVDIRHKLSLIGDSLKNDTHFITISKSGETIESIAILKYLSSLVKIDKTNSTIISESDSALSNFANKKYNQIKIFIIDKNIGGRFCVFSPAGLVCLAIVGVNIDMLLKGANYIKQSFFNKQKHYEIIIQKARFFVENKHRFNTNVVFSYSTSLEGFNKWYIQLWGESLGKLNINKTAQSHTPIGLIGPIDQHSFLQLIIEGKRDKSVTFIKIDNFKDKTKIPQNSLVGYDKLDYINGLSFSKLIHFQANATIKAVLECKDIPCDVITLNRVDETSIAKLMFSYQLITSIVAKFVKIDAYNQPGVEYGKIILKDMLQNDNSF
jgi:glucose-6-phosphate isomerase